MGAKVTSIFFGVEIGWVAGDCGVCTSFKEAEDDVWMIENVWKFGSGVY